MREKSEFSLNSNFFFLRESRRSKKDRTTINWIVKKRTRYKKKKRKRKKKETERRSSVGNVTRNTKVWMSEIDDVYRKIVEVESASEILRK